MSQHIAYCILHIANTFAQTNPFGNANDLGIPTTDAGPGALQSALGGIFLITGALAVVFVVVGGLRYVSSAGRPAEIQNAKNTLIYALVGLVVSLSAYGIVNFVIDGLIS